MQLVQWAVWGSALSWRDRTPLVIKPCRILRRRVCTSLRTQLCVDYPGSGVPRTECSQEWLLWTGNQHGRDRHWRTYDHLWNVYTIQTSYCCWASHHRTVFEVFCRYPRVLSLRSQETSSPHAVPCTHKHCCLPSWLTVSGLARDMWADYQ